MECPTYKLLLVNSKSATNDDEMEKIKKLLSNIPESDYYITIEHTPLNPTCHYTTSIIILKSSHQEAEPIAEKIASLLSEHDIKTEKFSSTLLWKEPAVYLKIR